MDEKSRAHNTVSRADESFDVTLGLWPINRIRLAHAEKSHKTTAIEKKHTHNKDSNRHTTHTTKHKQTQNTKSRYTYAKVYWKQTHKQRERERERPRDHVDHLVDSLYTASS